LFEKGILHNHQQHLLGAHSEADRESAANKEPCASPAIASVGRLPKLLIVVV